MLTVIARAASSGLLHQPRRILLHARPRADAYDPREPRGATQATAHHRGERTGSPKRFQGAAPSRRPTSFQSRYLWTCVPPLAIQYTELPERLRSAARDHGLSMPPDAIASPLHRLVPSGVLYRPITRSIPEKMASICRLVILPTRSVNCRLSTVTSCATFATESRSNPVCFALRSTLPGATDQRRLLVRATHTTVAIWLWFSGSDCTTTTGRR